MNFTAESLKDKPAGVHSVSCEITAHDSDNVFYRERSADAAFVIAKGVKPESIMTWITSSGVISVRTLPRAS